MNYSVTQRHPFVIRAGNYPLKASQAIKFGSNKALQNAQSELAQAVVSELPKGEKASSVVQSQLLQAIKKGKPLPLGKGYQFDYGILMPDGTVNSPSTRLKALVEPIHSKSQNRSSFPQPILMKVRTPETGQSLQAFINNKLKKDFSFEYKDKNGITSNSVILTDLVEKLIAGKLDNTTAHQEVSRILTGQVASYDHLREIFEVKVPGNQNLTRMFNQNNLTRQKLIGLELAQKIYADSQEVEWQSIALSLALGIVGEPTINHIFKDGGPIASTARTALMSGIDIMGNVLSVMGVVNENLKARSKKLSLDTIYGPKDKRTLLKNLLNPQGEAGPDIKQGVKAGVLGGMLGVLFNVPAGTILSMPKADVLQRSVIGGIGAAGSAVAIPPIIKSSKENFETSIKKLIETDKISLPPGTKIGSAEYKQFVEKMALKEMNARIGIASSIKATHPIPLVGTGAVILAGEKLGIPREYVQTAYMAIAPVMHNFLRLGSTGIEKYWTIPRRMKKLEALVSQSQDRAMDNQQLQAMDKAFLSSQDKWLSQGLSQSGYVFTLGAVLLAAEVLYFTQAFQKNKEQPVLTKKTYPPPPVAFASPLPFSTNTPHPFQPPQFLNSAPYLQRPGHFPAFPIQSISSPANFASGGMPIPVSSQAFIAPITWASSLDRIPS